MVSSFPGLNLLPTAATASPGFIGLGFSNPAGIANASISPMALASIHTSNVLSFGSPVGLINNLTGVNSGATGSNPVGLPNTVTLPPTLAPTMTPNVPNMGNINTLGGINTGFNGLAGIGLTGGGLGMGANPFVDTLGGSTGVPVSNGGTGIQGSIQNDPQLQASVAKIQKDPDGAELLKEALARGYNIRVGDPASALGLFERTGSVEARTSCPTCQSNAMAVGGVIVLGATITNGINGNEIIINPNSPDFDKTLVHELYHAATDENGTSKSEEAFANILGDKVSANVNGRPRRDPQDIINETIPLYPDLPDFN